MKLHMLGRAVVLIAIALVAAGCGGGGGGAIVPASRTAKLRIALTWPALTRGINAPSSAASVVVSVSGGRPDGSDFQWTINRGSQSGTHTVLVTSDSEVRSGTQNIGIDFHASPDGRGSVVARGASRQSVGGEGDGVVEINPTIKSTIESVTILPGQSIGVDNIANVLYAIKNKEGKEVFVDPNYMVFEILSGGAFIDLQQGGIARGVKPGKARIRASANGVTSELESIEVIPVGIKVRSVRLAVVQGIGGGTTTGTVTLEEAAPAGGAKVWLDATPRDILSFGDSQSNPATIDIPAGQLSATFQVGVALPREPATVTISARVSDQKKTTEIAINTVDILTLVAPHLIDDAGTLHFSGESGNVVRLTGVVGTGFTALSSPPEVKVRIAQQFWAPELTAEQSAVKSTDFSVLPPNQSLTYTPLDPASAAGLPDMFKLITTATSDKSRLIRNTYFLKGRRWPRGVTSWDLGFCAITAGATENVGTISFYTVGASLLRTMQLRFLVVEVVGGVRQSNVVIVDCPRVRYIKNVSSAGLAFGQTDGTLEASASEFGFAVEECRLFVDKLETDPDTGLLRNAGGRVSGIVVNKTTGARRSFSGKFIY